MCVVVLARFPHFVQQECACAIRRAMQIVLQAAVFFPRRRHQRAKLRFKKRLVTGTRAHQHNQRHAILRQLRMIRRARFPRASIFSGSLLCFPLCHGGGDCTPKAPIGKQSSNTVPVSVCASVANQFFRLTSRRPCAPHSSCQSSSPYSAPAHTSREFRRDTPD